MGTKKGSLTDSLPPDLLIKINGKRSWWNWDFSDVPPEELEACCWWEYARESLFIRRLQQLFREEWHPDDWVSAAAHGEYTSERLLEGFQEISHCGPYAECIAEELTGPFKNQRFPAAWQSLKPKERKERVFISEIVLPERPDHFGAILIRKHSETTGAKMHLTLRPGGPFEACLHVPASFTAFDGVDFAVVRIPWRQLTNHQISEAFRKWIADDKRPKDIKRPKDMPEPKSSERGHKYKDLRADLTRLAVMRLLSHHTFNELNKHFSEVWDTKQFQANKWGEAFRWNAARREAGEVFQSLWPELSVRERPLSWQTKTERKKSA